LRQRTRFLAAKIIRTDSTIMTIIVAAAISTVRFDAAGLGLGEFAGVIEGAIEGELVGVGVGVFVKGIGVAEDGG